MIPSAAADWDAQSYARFRAERLRPALDLMMQVGTPSAGTVFDLGCGDGAAAAGLRARFPKRQIVGIDASPAMLAAARGYQRTVHTSIEDWQPDAPAAVIYANAALTWLGNHASLMPRLAGHLVSGGALAVQMPRQSEAPAHRLMRDIYASLFPDRLAAPMPPSPVLAAAEYHAILSSLGKVNAWETDYLHHLVATPGQHPVRAFTAGAAMRPFAARMDDVELRRFQGAYDDALAAAYPLRPDGSVLFTFTRVFFILEVP